MKLRIAITALVASLFMVQLAPVAYADPGLTITLSPDYLYGLTDTSFKLGAITVQNAPTRVIADIQLTDLQNARVSASDNYRLDIGTLCTFENSASATIGTVKISGDESAEIMLEGLASDVTEVLQNIWVYNAANGDCNQTALGTDFAKRRVQVSMVESIEGISWSPKTKHYYKLATQDTSDGMGQPTDDAGNITDASRYFVTWTTARAKAKAATINVGGNQHKGYLAAITSRSEFEFLNNNVSGGSGTLYPAWVGGTDQMHEGTWNWVDGPEAASFGGDMIGSTIVDPFGSTYLQSQSGAYTLQTPWGIDYPTDPLLAVDENGNTYFSPEGALVNINAYQYCTDENIVNAYSDGNGLVTYPTGYGSNLVCQVSLQSGMWGSYWSVSEFHLEDANGNSYFQTFSNPANEQFFYLYDFTSNYSWQGRYLDGNSLIVSSQSFTTQPDQFFGATFWGPDSGIAVSSTTPDLCTQRGATGKCKVAQVDSTAHVHTNDYYVHWSNGDATHSGKWDGVHLANGDGVYAPQPDNYTGNDAEGEDALIINWCARNDNVTNSNAITQSLYGNSGYRCTPGWNDLPANNWNFASEFYPNGYYYDTPNHIGTTDYIIEFCGYDDEVSCAAETTAIVHQGFSATASPTSAGQSALQVSFEAADVMQTTLSSATMKTEPFNCGYNGTSDFGWFSDFANGVLMQTAKVVGGANGTGCFPTAIDSTLSLDKPQKYLGFWWSAGNWANYVELLNEDDEVLATFTASDLVANLGACPSNPYCGNPAMNHALNSELYAFVNLRFADGFSKIRFHGSGFELDNVTVSETVPNRNATETTVTSAPVTTDCTGVTAAQAEVTLVACPRTISIPFGSSTTIAPLVESQIAGFSYGANVHVVSAYVYQGSGDAVLLTNDQLSVLAHSVGQLLVDFAISDGTSTVTSRITVNVYSDSVAMTVPNVIPVDPRSTWVDLPALQIGTATDNTVCFVQVTNATADTQATSTFDVVQTNLSSPVSINSASGYFSSSSSNSDMQTALSTLRIVSNSADSITKTGSVYLKVGAVNGLNVGDPPCESATWQVIEIRPLGLERVDVYPVTLAH